MPTYRAMQGEEFDDRRIWVGDDPFTWRALSVSARTVRDDEGVFAGAALAHNDVTEFMRALKVKDDFIASVSHELRTPLTSIRGYADLLLDRGGPAGRRRAAAGGRHPQLRAAAPARRGPAAQRPDRQRADPGGPHPR